MLPIATQDGQRINPRDVRVTNENGASLQSKLAWIKWGSRDVQSWTSDPRGPSVEPFREDDRPDMTRRLILLIQIPTQVQGDIFLSDQRLRPVWYEIPERGAATRGGRLVRVDSPSRPDPNCPFEYWRWVLLAEQFSVEPPEIEHFDKPAQLVAEHFVNLWTIGLDRLSQYSPGVAGQVREVLTRICMDESVAFATWASDPASLNHLLSELLHQDRSPEQLAREALRWVKTQRKPLVWIEADSASHVRMAMVNPDLEPVVVRMTWAGIDEVPIAVELPPGQLTRALIDRPDDAEQSTNDDANMHVLQVDVGDWQEQFTFGPARHVATPPGLLLPPLEPTLTLMGVRTGSSVTVDSDRATLVQIRKRAGRWEVFFECRRPRDEVHGKHSGEARLQTIEDFQGREGVLLVIGDDELRETLVQLFVPESGWHQLLEGENDGTLQIHRRSYEDRWYCRIVLPDVWLNTVFEDDVTNLGMIRSHGGGEPMMQFAPYATPPWGMKPGTMPVNLSQWRDIPGGGS